MLRVAVDSVVNLGDARVHWPSTKGPRTPATSMSSSSRAYGPRAVTIEDRQKYDQVRKPYLRSKGTKHGPAITAHFKLEVLCAREYRPFSCK